MAVSGPEVDNCSVIYSNHLLIVLQLQGITDHCGVNLVTYTVLGGATPHFINKTILLHRPIGMMYSVAVLRDSTL